MSAHKDTRYYMVTKSVNTKTRPIYIVHLISYGTGAYFGFYTRIVTGHASQGSLWFVDKGIRLYGPRPRPKWQINTPRQLALGAF